MKKLAAFLVTMSTMLVVNAQSIDKQSSWYAEGALDLVSWGAYAEESNKSSLSPKAVRMVIGKRVMPSLSVEATAGFGMGSASSSSKEVKVKSVLGLYGKYSYEVIPKLDIYGKAGFAMITSETGVPQPKETPTSPNVTSVSAKRSAGLSFGFGASYDITDKYYVGADYTFHPKAPELTGWKTPGSVSAITFFGGMRY
jgi:opacity protein-like surface antigen